MDNLNELSKYKKHKPAPFASVQGANRDLTERKITVVKHNNNNNNNTKNTDTSQRSGL